MRTLAPLIILLVACMTGAADVASDPAAASPTHAFLTHEFGIAASDMRDLERRRAVGRSLHTNDGREVATMGVVHVRVPAEFYVSQLKDVVRFKRAEAVQQIGTFGTPARIEDLARLTIPTDQLEKLRRCRPHDCNLQLSAAAIARFQDVNWHSPAAGEQANGVLRRVLVEMVNTYRRDGAGALMEYADRRTPVASARAFEAMLADPPAVLQRFPALHQHVLRYPAAPPPAVHDLIYWSREKMGPAVIISVTHMAYVQLDSPAGAYAVASRQLYGSQYFDASLGLTLLLPDRDDKRGAYLVYVNRSRLDVLGGFFGAVKRPVVRSRTRSAVTDHLVKVRDMVERRFTDWQAASVSPGEVSASHPQQ
jgi:hypothetical protein